MNSGNLLPQITIFSSPSLQFSNFSPLFFILPLLLMAKRKFTELFFFHSLAIAVVSEVARHMCYKISHGNPLWLLRNL
jgi:hypothetical protein